jgi:O-6-methylguanine DNA methyltransferase
MEKLFYTTLKTPIQSLLILSSEKGLVRIMFIDTKQELFLHKLKNEYTDITFVEDKSKNQTALDQLKEYFAGTRKNFTLPLDLRGTPFQKQVWAALGQVPYGQTCSYGEIASRIGKPGSARAVGMANHNNPIPIVIPCHRIIGADGSLTGYGAGIHIKEKLLNLEKENIESN